MSNDSSIKPAPNPDINKGMTSSPPPMPSNQPPPPPPPPPPTPKK
ncbi:MAG: hypothetical protein ACKVOM_05715 [Ferruginibacter sp.]